MRRLILIIVALGIVSACLILWPRTSNDIPKDTIHRRNADRIFGMTQAEVEAVFGKPGEPTDPNDVPPVYVGHYSFAIVWEGADGRIQAFFDHSGRVSAVGTNLPSRDSR
jgi:hypothetical protein